MRSRRCAAAGGSGERIRDQVVRPALIYDPKRQPRADVELTLEIRHRRDCNAEIDGCEKRCRAEIVAALRSFGTGEGTWTARRDAMGC